MNNKRNLPEAFDDIKASLQARAIIDVLDRESMTNDRILSAWLNTIGLGISHRSLSERLDRMEKEGLLRTERVENIRVVHLLRMGREVALGHEASDWIARRELPD
jgi:DNA-binding HxlR family transcriptional regulator